MMYRFKTMQSNLELGGVILYLRYMRNTIEDWVQNLISREWVYQSWEPEFTTNGNMDFTPTEIRYALYRVKGEEVQFRLFVDGTTSGTGVSTIYASMPPVEGEYQQSGEVFSTRVFDGSDALAFGFLAGGLIGVQKNSGTWGIGTSRRLVVTGSYRKKVTND